MMKRLWVMLAAAMALVPAHGARAAEAPRAQTRLERVALFKNGLGYFVRRGVLPASRSAVLLGPFAAPVHGTFWVTTPATAGLERVAVHATRVKGEEVEARSVGELLRANVGRQVTVWTDPEGKTAITGTIHSFAPDPPAAVPPRPLYQMGVTRTSGASSRPYDLGGYGAYVLLKTASGMVSINPGTVTRVTFAGEVATRYQREVPGSGVELTVNVRSPQPKDWVGLSYLAKGITWAPSYQVDISDPKVAKLSAKALIVNEAEDLTDTHVDLITGFPNLQFAEVTSPIAKHTDLAGFLQQLTGGGYRAPMGALSNVMSQSVSYDRPTEAATPNYGLPAAGEQVADLFFYPVENVTLRAGDTGYYPLFTIEAPYRQVYQWEVTGDASQDAKQTIWHSLRLTNTGKVPWTTAPAETVKKGMILGQDTLSYTPPKGEETLRITQAVNVRGQWEEVETNRELQAVRRYQGIFGVETVFDRVTLRGTLRLTNFTSEPVTVEVKKTVQGEVTETSPQATVKTLATTVGAINQTRQLTWEAPVAPGQTQELMYTYQVLVQR